MCKKFIYTIAIIITLSISGCDYVNVIDDVPFLDENLSTDSSLKGFSFQMSDNSSLKENCSGIIGSDIVYITVPDGVSLENLVATINVHGNAIAKVDHDYSKTATITIVSEAGTTSEYSVLVRNGNSKIDNKVYQFMLKHNVPGVSLALTKDEQTVYSAGYGFANIDNKERVTDNHLFRLASMSKQHTAIAVMTLMERGQLGLDSTVFGIGGLLEEEFGNNMGDGWKQITVRDLLSHSSGIAEDCIFPSVSGYSGLSLEDRIARLLERSETPGYEIGRFSYNNSNFGILGKIVESLSGKEFIQFLKEEVYGPIGIEDIYMGMNDVDKKRNNEVTYYGQNGKNPYGNDVEEGVAAGGVIATPVALMKLMAHIDYGTKVPDIFKKETLDLMYTAKAGMTSSSGAAWNRYGLGWRVNYPNIPSWAAYHGGTLAGVASVWARSKTNVNGVILCNSRSYDMSIDDEMWEMLEDLQIIIEEDYSTRTQVLGK